MRGRIVAGAVGLGCAGLVVLTALTFVTPAVAERRAPARACAPSDCEMPAGDVAADCREAAMTTAAGSAGLQLTTDVPEGAIVEPGQEIGVSLTWDPKAWSGEELDMALACVRVKGGLDPDMSARERPTANDGVFEYRLVVPENIKPDCDICIEGFLAGMTADGGLQLAGSDPRCFMSGPPSPPRPPATTPAAPTPPATTPPATMPAAPATTTTTAVAVPLAPPADDVPAQVAGISTVRPEPARPPAAAPAEAAPTAELPRTGPATAIQLVSAGGGLTLTLGGMAVIGGAGRRARRRAAG